MDYGLNAAQHRERLIRSRQLELKPHVVKLDEEMKIQLSWEMLGIIERFRKGHMGAREFSGACAQIKRDAIHALRFHRADAPACPHVAPPAPRRVRWTVGGFVMGALGSAVAVVSFMAPFIAK